MAIISDHALLRYLERIQGMNIRDLKKKAVKLGYVLGSDSHTLGFLQRSEGVDIEALRKSLITPELLAALRIGAKTICLDGVIYVLQKGTVVTLYQPIKIHKRMRPVMRKNQFRSQHDTYWEVDA